MEDLDNMPDIDWDAEPSQPVKNEKEFKCAGPKEDPRPLIPEGSYEAVCIKHEISPYLGKGKKLFLTYQIIQGEYMGIKLFQAINHNYNAFSPSTKYYTEWTIANGDMPKRKDKMTPRIFKDKAFLVKVKTTKPKYEDGEYKPEKFHYSTVERIIEVLT